MGMRAQISRYLDGELTPEDAEAFERRLVRSAELRAQLEELLELDATASALAERARESGTELPAVADTSRGGDGDNQGRFSLAGWLDGWIGEGRRLAPGMVLALCVLVALSAVMAVWVVENRSRDGEVEKYFAELHRGYTAARVTYALADQHRAYDPYLSESGAGEKPPPGEVLVALEAAKAYHGIAAAYLLSGSPELAEQYLVLAALERSKPDENLSAKQLNRLKDNPPRFAELDDELLGRIFVADLFSDLAAVALSLGDNKRALQMATRAIELAGDHVQAHWNQGLAYEKLGNNGGAIRSFGRVVGRAEPGWANEAAGRIRQMRSGGT